MPANKATLVCGKSLSAQGSGTSPLNRNFVPQNPARRQCLLYLRLFAERRALPARRAAKRIRKALPRKAQTVEKPSTRARPCTRLRLFAGKVL